MSQAAPSDGLSLTEHPEPPPAMDSESGGAIERPLAARSKTRMPPPSATTSPSIESWKAMCVPLGFTVGFDAYQPR
jgi:hypothetical protein